MLGLMAAVLWQMRRIDKEYVEAYTDYVEAFDKAIDTIQKLRKTKAIVNHLQANSSAYLVGLVVVILC